MKKNRTGSPKTIADVLAKEKRKKIAKGVRVDDKGRPKCSHCEKGKKKKKSAMKIGPQPRMWGVEFRYRREAVFCSEGGKKNPRDTPADALGRVARHNLGESLREKKAATWGRGKSSSRSGNEGNVFSSGEKGMVGTGAKGGTTDFQNESHQETSVPLSI